MRPAAAIGMALLATTFSLTSHASPVPTHLLKRGESRDLDRLQGHWKLESVQIGSDIPIKGVEVSMEFRGYTVRTKSAQQITTMTIEFDTSNGMKRLRMTNGRKTTHDGMPLGKEEDAIFGYVLDGDTLKLATVFVDGRAAGAADPAKHESTTMVMTFTRSKDKK